MSAVLTEKPPTLDEILGPHWRDIEWRLANLYWIVNENGKAVPFVANEEQLDFIRHLHTRNLILKARQLGFSTLIQILQVDQGLFNADHNGVTISDTLPSGGKLFAKIEFALKRLPSDLTAALPIKSSSGKTSIEWAHGSTISVGTSARGGTVQLLHVSELGKIARKWPERAAEIVSGAFEAVPQDGIIVVESTAEGAAGEFYDLCSTALKRQQEGAPETPLDWRLHFYPWFKKAAYRLDPELVIVTDKDHAYFNKLQAELAIQIDPAQRAWYVKKRETLGRLMKREYPSTPQEAFEQAIEGAVFGEEMTVVREAGRITVVPLDVNHKVNTFWDFGLADSTAIWFHQRIGLQNRWWNHIEGNGRDLRHWWVKVCEELRNEHGFQWGRHHLPHDADAEILGESITTKHRILTSLGMKTITVVPRVADKSTAIELVRQKLPTDNWFDRERCAQGIKCLDGYQFEWDDRRGLWSNEPLHNWASHSVDAWMQFAQGYTPTSETGSSSINSFKNRKRGWR